MPTLNKFREMDPVSLFADLLARGLEHAVQGLFIDALEHLRDAYQNGGDYAERRAIVRAMFDMIEGLRTGDQPVDHSTFLAYFDSHIAEFLATDSDQTAHWQAEFADFLSATK